jgi:hypothetical protein
MEGRKRNLLVRWRHAEEVSAMRPSPSHPSRNSISLHEDILHGPCKIREGRPNSGQPLFESVKAGRLVRNGVVIVKLLWLAIRDIEDKRARARAKEKGAPRNKRKAPGRLVEGATIQDWRQALNALAITYPGRLPEHLT